jgi:hypothetical protein
MPANYTKVALVGVDKAQGAGSNRSDFLASAGRRNDVELVIGYKFIAFEGTLHQLPYTRYLKVHTGQTGTDYNYATLALI